MEFTIRRAKPEESEQITAITRASKSYWGYSQALMDLWWENLSIPAEYIAAHPVFVAEWDGRLLGYFSLSGAGEVQELDNLFIAPEYIGRGVGKRLFRFALEQLRSNGARRVRIVADPHAEAFYKRFGARRIGTAPSIPEGRELPLMLLDLDSEEKEIGDDREAENQGDGSETNPSLSG